MSDDDSPDDPSGKRDIPLDADLLFTKYEDEKRAAQKALDKVEELEEHTYKLRQQKKELKEQVPGDGDVVLNDEEAAQLRELGALGDDGTLQAGQVQERLQEAEQAEEELQSYRRWETRREVYEATGLNEEAAEDILSGDLGFETETAKEDGEEVTKAFVAGEDGRTPVEDYIEEQFSKPIQNALYGEGGSREDSEGGSTPNPPEQTPAGEDEPGPDEPGEEEIRQQKRSQINYGV
ncbi:hypothetical protein [Salinibacter altiplanensis]|uniref:hypothetical protein n=1 Tax=Salinibacter altiplanensis TaxID=1803181 RepID=UPI000C9F6A98|nr:hypothetical protein [Salinibacter altiplanensis]